MHFSFFEVLVLVGVTQGFVLSVWIWLGKRSSSKILLSWMLTVFNLLCIKILILVTGLWEIRFVRYLPLAFELAIQPLVYLYVCSLTRRGFKLKKADLLHFIPFALSFAYSSFVYIRVLPVHSLAAKDVLADQLHFNGIKELEDYGSILSSFVYWYAGFRQVLLYRRWLYDNISDTDYPTYAWLRNICILLGVLILGLSVDILLDTIGHFGVRHFFHWQLFFVYLAMLIYYLGFRGFLLPDKKERVALVTGDAALPVEMPERAGVEMPEQSGPGEWGCEEWTDAERQERVIVENAIRQAFELDKLYLDPELNLPILAKHISKSPAVVSSVINKELGESFRGMVNTYRVEAVKLRLQDPASRHLSILGVAYECGFNSEASFYRIFKAATGLSPKEYISEGKKGSQNVF